MANSFGIVCNSRVTPPPGEREALGVTYLRSLLYSTSELPSLIALTNGTGRLIITLNNENWLVGSNWSGWETALLQIAAYGSRIYAVECGNELDGYWARNPADCPPEFGADLVRRANAILAPAGIYTLVSSVAGPNWQDWLAQAVALCHDQANGVSLHPYGQRPDGFKAPGWGFGDLRDAITRAHEIATLPVYLTEFGVKISDAGGEQDQADYARTAVETIASLGPDVVPAACYFAWRDDVGTSSEQGADAFGLRRPDNSARPAWTAYQQAIVATAPVPVPTPQPEPEPAPEPALVPLDAAYAALWRAVVPDLALNADSALYKAWRANHRDWGSPITSEIPDADGTVLMTFAVAGPMRWTGGDAVEAA